MPSRALSGAAIEPNQTVISATLDTSFYVRALHFGGPATIIIGNARVGTIRIDISEAIVAETNRVLRDKFQWDGYMLQDAREKLRALGNHVSPTETLHVIKEDSDDDRILECAATAKSDFIVSEDKDLLRLGQFGSARIVSIRDFITMALTTGITR
ncbi:MAG: putative toxin-antitoxin system toxin component, PIN family [Acidobacteriota bacterium]|nr:putative toxin-antitoxin system toxin component, PIN family [Acidobacteriota bacterium]